MACALAYQSGVDPPPRIARIFKGFCHEASAVKIRPEQNFAPISVEPAGRFRRAAVRAATHRDAARYCFPRPGGGETFRASSSIRGALLLGKCSRAGFLWKKFLQRQALSELHKTPEKDSRGEILFRNFNDVSNARRSLVHLRK